MAPVSLGHMPHAYASRGFLRLMTDVGSTGRRVVRMFERDLAAAEGLQWAQWTRGGTCDG